MDVWWTRSVVVAGLGFLAGLGLTVSACSAPPPDVRTDVAGVDAEQTVVVGRFLVHVDPTAELGQIFRVERIESEGAPLRDEGHIGGASAALESVLSQVSFHGPGSWDAATKRLTATVRLTNLGTADFDEPRLMVVWHNRPGQLTFEKIHYGDGDVGSGWGYADIEAPPGANNASAKQDIAIHDPDVVSFSFQIDVLADVGVASSEIFPDRDDDRYNVEPEAEPAGGDCDDSEPTMNPSAGSCLCVQGCNTCGGEDNCCTEACTDTCDIECTTGCTCHVAGGSESTVRQTCQPHSQCATSCHGAQECTVERCQNADCDLDCEDTDTCGFTDCQVSADCDLICKDVGTCSIGTCKNSSCDITCTDVETCTLGCSTGSECRLTCGDGVTTCELSCQGGRVTDCGGGVYVCGTSCP